MTGPSEIIIRPKGGGSLQSHNALETRQIATCSDRHALSLANQLRRPLSFRQKVRFDFPGGYQEESVEKGLSDVMKVKGHDTRTVRLCRWQTPNL